jgi:hypothetical protein
MTSPHRQPLDVLSLSCVTRRKKTSSWFLIVFVFASLSPSLAMAHILPSPMQPSQCPWSADNFLVSSPSKESPDRTAVNQELEQITIALLDKPNSRVCLPWAWGL